MVYRRLCLGAVIVPAMTTALSAAQPPMAMFNFVSPLKGTSLTLPPSYEALLFTILSPDSDIQSIDLSTGINGITGRFVQRWTSSAGNGVYDVMNPAGSARNVSAADGNPSPALQ